MLGQQEHFHMVFDENDSKVTRGKEEHMSPYIEFPFIAVISKKMYSTVDSRSVRKTALHTISVYSILFFVFLFFAFREKVCDP